MRQHGICLLCLQETHLDDAEHFEYEGFKIFLSGEALREGRSFSGVGFIVAPWVVQAVVSFHAINDRLAKIRFKVFGGILNVLTVYVPHDGHDFDYRQSIIGELLKHTRVNHEHESTLVFGDFNAQFGCVGVHEEHVIGQYVFKKSITPKPNIISNRDLLLEYCATDEMMASNTFFDYPDEYLVSYLHLTSKPMDPITSQTFSQIGHVVCGQTMQV